LLTYSQQFWSLEKFTYFLRLRRAFILLNLVCPTTALLLPYYCPDTTLLLPRYYPSTTLLLPCYYPATALLLPYYCPAAAATTILSPLKSSNTSGCIILVIAASPPYSSNSESPRISVTLNSAIYSCLYVKTGIYKLTPIKLKDCPCNLFTVIAKYSWIRNYLLLIINGSSPSIEVSLI